jgi:PAS domain S-box-containing protein
MENAIWRPFPIDRQSAERLELALDAGAVVGTWLWDVPADEVKGDERFARSFNLSPEACRAGISFACCLASIHSDDRAGVVAAVEEALARGGRHRHEFRVQQRDGAHRWIEANGRVEVDADGKPQRFAGVMLDIETRRHAEAERDRVSALLRTFAAAVPGVIYAKDRAGRMLVANHGTTELIGKPPAFYLGKTDREFLDDKAQAEVIMANDQRIMETGIAEQIEEEVRLPDGTAATWLSTKSPLRNEHGEIIGLVGSSIDVTARIKAELAVQELNRTLEQNIENAFREREIAHEALRQSQKMEAVGQLTGGLAHDFNNLLTAIGGSLEMLQTRIAQGKYLELDRYVGAAQGAARRAATLTHRLLAFARRQTLDPKSTDVNRLVLDMEELVHRTVGPQIQIEVVAAGGLWPTQVDQNQLENALLNLCINARDAMPGGGRITIETANKWLDDRAAAQRDLAPGQYVCLSVSDTGSGMTPEVVSRAFDPFFTTKPLGEGTGLGLSMIYGFARQSGGQVRIYSEPGQGTTVSLYLPRDATSLVTEMVEQGPRPVNLAGQGEVVLVVDDEPAVRMLIAEVLEEFGYAWIEAVDGPSGMKALRSSAHIDLLITDVGLPGGMNGRQLADAARFMRPGLKILFITGYAENAVVRAGHLGVGMQVLTKPFSMETLAQRINSIFAR